MIEFNEAHPRYGRGKRSDLTIVLPMPIDPDDKACAVVTTIGGHAHQNEHQSQAQQSETGFHNLYLHGDA
jgi:hypothetical protein